VRKFYYDKGSCNYEVEYKLEVSTNGRVPNPLSLLAPKRDLSRNGRGNRRSGPFARVRRRWTDFSALYILKAIGTLYERSFVYDIADLYKADISIPIAFEIAEQQPEDIGAVTRRAVRDAIADGSILERMVKDIRELLLGIAEDGSLQEVSEIDTNTVQLWDDKNGFVKNAISYGKELDELGSEETALSEGYGTLLPEEET